MGLLQQGPRCNSPFIFSLKRNKRAKEEFGEQEISYGILTRHLEANPYALLLKLSGIGQVYRITTPVSGYLVVQLAYVVGHGVEEHLGQYVDFASAKEPTETISLLQYAKSTLRLYRPV